MLDLELGFSVKNHGNFIENSTTIDNGLGLQIDDFLLSCDARSSLLVLRNIPLSIPRFMKARNEELNWLCRLEGQGSTNQFMEILVELG